MPKEGKIILVVGISLLLLSIFNYYTSDLISPSFERSEILACISSIFIILLATFWIKIVPKSPTKVILKGKQGLHISKNLEENIKEEIGWGSHLLLTSTPAATVLIYKNGETILKRGILSDENFVPGLISARATKTEKLISLVNTKLFPGKDEFDSILKNLPSIIVMPIGKDGYLIVGGSSERCFSRSHELFIESWGLKLFNQFYKLENPN